MKPYATLLRLIIIFVVMIVAALLILLVSGVLSSDTFTHSLAKVGEVAVIVLVASAVILLVGQNNQ